MTQRLAMLSPDQSVGEALHLFKERHISAAPVLDGADLVGLVSTSDIVALATSIENYEHRRLRDVMTPEVVVISPGESLESAAKRMVYEQIHRLVVQDGLRVAGILSARDLMGDVKEQRRPVQLADIMSSPVASVDMGETVDGALVALAKSGVHGLVVVDGSWPIGVFSQLEALELRHLPLPLRAHALVEQVMSYETLCLDTQTPVHRAAGYALAMDVRRILVVEKRELVGMVSCLDLVGTLVGS